MSEFPDWPLVVVEWWDSCGCSSWVVLDGKQATDPSWCRSVGWMAVQDKERIVLYSDLATNVENKYASGHSEQIIPRGAVASIKVLRAARKRK